MDFRIQPNHKRALAIAGIGLLALGLVYLGYAWGCLSTYVEGQSLSTRKTQAALALIEAMDPAAADRMADLEDSKNRLSHSHYEHWLEKTVQAQAATSHRSASAVGAAEPSEVQSPVPSPAPALADSIRLARMVATGAIWVQEVAPPSAEPALRRRASAVATQLVEEAWESTNGQALSLPADLYLVPADGVTAAEQAKSSAAAVRKVAQTPTSASATVTMGTPNPHETAVTTPRLAGAPVMAPVMVRVGAGEGVRVSLRDTILAFSKAAPH